MAKENLSGADKIEVFHRPNPYDLFRISATFDDREVAPPPRTYILAEDPERELEQVVDSLQESFEQGLLFVGLTGSRVIRPVNPGSDLDVIAIVTDDAQGDGLEFEGDLKIVSKSGLRAFIECGYQLITTQFRKAQPLYEIGGALDEERSLVPIPGVAIPFLRTKSKFNEQTADILKLTSDKHRAIFFHQIGLTDESYTQLQGIEHDDLFRSYQEEFSKIDSEVYGMLAMHYANLGLNRMFHSLSEMAQALHILENGNVADVEELIEWTEDNITSSGSLFRRIHEKRRACYKQGELLLDTEYDAIREGIRVENRVLEEILIAKL